MKEYLLSIIGIVLISSILLAIMPDGKTASVIKGTTKLSCLLVIISPIIGYFDSNIRNSNNAEKAGNFFQETVIDEDESFIQYYSEKRIRLAERALEEEILEQFQVYTETTICWEFLDVQMNLYSENTVKICSITVKCKDVMEENMKKKVCEYLENKYCSEVLIE